MTQTVGKVYAEALFALAQEEDQAQQIYQELNEFADIMQEHPNFVRMLGVPTLSVEERLHALRQVIGEGTGSMENFLCLLVERHRFSALPDIRSAFNQLYDDTFGIAEVFVTSAVPLEPAQCDALAAKLKAKLGREIHLHEAVDPSLLGGMVVQYGDTRMDNSLRTRMQQFRQN